jgi:hypothetical protein
MKKTLFALILSTAAMAASAHAVIPTNGLIAHYPFHGDLNDYSGNNNNISAIKSGIQFTNNRFGISNSAITFTQTNACGASARNLGITGNQSHSISLWVNAITTPNNSGIAFIIGRDKITNYGGLNCFVFAKNELYVESQNQAIYNKTPLTGLTLTNSSKYNWHNVIFVYNGTPSNSVMYYDGTKYKVSLYSSSTKNLNIIDAPLSIGWNSNSIGLNTWPCLKGSMSDLRVYNRAISDDEASTIYTSEQVQLPTLVYNVSGALNYSTAQTNFIQSYGGFFVYDYSSLKSSFIMLKSQNTYHVEPMNDVDFHASTPSIGGLSLYSVANADGTFPNIEKDVLWLSGTNSIINLNNMKYITAPAALSGFANSLTLTNGVLISTYNASLAIDTTNSTVALTNNESFDATISRLTNYLGRQGYSPVQ